MKYSKAENLGGPFLRFATRRRSKLFNFRYSSNSVRVQEHSFQFLFGVRYQNHLFYSFIGSFRARKANRSRYCSRKMTRTGTCTVTMTFSNYAAHYGHTPVLKRGVTGFLYGT